MKANKPNATYFCYVMKRWYLNENAANNAYRRSIKAKVGTDLKGRTQPELHNINTKTKSYPPVNINKLSRPPIEK